MICSRVLASFNKVLPQQYQPLSVCVNFFHTSVPDFGSRHGGMYKKDYRTLRERPLGPHKTLPPNQKYDGRIGPMKNYRYRVEYPEDGKYTIRKLPLVKLGGRDPETGRKIIGQVGGGSKQKFRWIDYQRIPDDWPRDGPDLVEKVIHLAYDPVRKPILALTGYKDKLRWQTATVGMEEGMIITSTWHIPTIPVKPQPGNSYPLGALPMSTEICLLQKYPEGAKSEDDMNLFTENASGRIMRKVGDRVIVEFENKFQRSYDQRCQCVVGKVSIHPLKALDIGSPNRNRWLGIRPKSGLWHRKEGKHGRKIRALPPVIKVEKSEDPKDQTIVLTCRSEGTKGRIRQKKRKDLPDLLLQW